MSSLPNPKNLESQAPKKIRRPRYSLASNAITSRQAKPYERAIDRAAALTLALKFLTVTWDKTNRASFDDLENVQWLRQWQRKWLWQRHAAFYDLGVREVGDERGRHWHQLLHCPDAIWRAFQKDLKEQLKPAPGGLQQRKPPPSLIDCHGCSRPRDWHHLARCYFLKGGTDEVRARNRIDLCALVSDRYKPEQGTIQGKRLFHSRSLGDKANRIRVAGNALSHQSLK